MPNMSAQALRGAVAQAAISDPAFRTELVADANKAIETRFGKQSYGVNVYFEQEKEVVLLIPEKTDALARSLDRIAKDAGSGTPTRGQFDAQLVQRAWGEPAFASELKGNPKAALDGLLKKYGSSVPADQTVKVHFDTPSLAHIVVPKAVAAGGELSDQELEAVAGGEAVVAICVVTVAGSVVGAVAGAIATVQFSDQIES
jgi:hypothetical protein